MLCKCHWIVLYTVHFTAFCLGGRFFSGHGVVIVSINFSVNDEMRTNVGEWLNVDVQRVWRRVVETIVTFSSRRWISFTVTERSPN